MKNYYKGVLLILLSALGFGLMPIFAKFAYQGGIGIPTLLFIRFSAAAIIFFLYVFIKVRKISLSLKQVGVLFILGGICYTLQSTLYFIAVKYISTSLAVLIFYVYPIFVALLAFLLEKEKLGGKMLLAMVVCFSGLPFILGDSLGVGNGYGIAAALGSSIVYSLYIVIGNKMVKDVQPVVTSAFVTGFAALTFLIIGLFTGNINFGFEPVTWLPIVGLILFSTILAIFTFFWGLELLGSTRASILSIMEPLFAITFSVIIFGEQLTALRTIGGTGVLIGAVLAVLAQKRDKG